jgi:alkylhydroperoxidase/carboxymuconolactone decarboxylase family protein YurZ
MGESPSSDEVRRRLAEVRAKRGYLLPHHGLLAIAAPELLAAYDATYTALTLAPRGLDAHDKEFVWLAILVATDEALASHHIAKFREAGGGDGAIELAVRLAGHAASAPRYAFPAEHWQRHLPRYDRARAYRAGLSALTAGSTVAPGLVEMAMAAAHICRRGWWELAEHIKGAYAAGVDELDLAEAIQLTMFPASVPNFVEACAVWRDLIASGAVAASPAFKLWAETLGQGGFDEASRR